MRWRFILDSEDPRFIVHDIESIDVSSAAVSLCQRIYVYHCRISEKKIPHRNFSFRSRKREGTGRTYMVEAWNQWKKDTVRNSAFKEVAIYISLLKDCAKKKDLYKGTEVHNDLLEKGFLGKYRLLDNILVSMYVKCGALGEAHQVFEDLPVRDVVAWSTLISGYAQTGQGRKALICFERMHNEGLTPDAIIFTCILKACGSMGAISKGQRIHEEIVTKGLLEKDIILGNALVDMYVKCRMLAKAQQVLHDLPIRDVISWNALISGYVEQGQIEDALDCFEQMQADGLSPDVVTFICMFNACVSAGMVNEGERIHRQVVEKGMLEKNVVIGNALVDMYAKFGLLCKAQEVFDNLLIRDVVSWNALIAGYTQQGQGVETFKYFEQMQSDGISPDAITFTCILNACRNTGETEKGKKIHSLIVCNGLLGQDTALSTALVDMYAKCCDLGRAQQTFDMLPVRSVGSWSSLMAGYTEQGQGQEALNLFEQMHKEGFSPDIISFISIVKTCGSIGAVYKGRQIHNEILSKGLVDCKVELGNALVDMYVKFGDLTKAQRVFDELILQDVVTWTTLISGYSQQGHGDEALKCFRLMLNSGHSPNAITLLCVLSACSHAGLVDEGQIYFSEMSEIFGIAPDKRHYACMVHLLGCAGFFDKAIMIMKKAPLSHYPLWVALLSTCQKWGNVKLGRLAYEQALYLDETNSAAYVCMTNIYTAAGLEEDARDVEIMRSKNCG